MDTLSGLLGLLDGNPPVIGWFSSQMASNAELFFFDVAYEQAVKHIDWWLMI